METGDGLQFQDHVFQHVSQPGALVLAHAAQKTARGVVGTSVLGEAGQGLDQPVDKFIAKTACGPFFEWSEIDYMADDRKSGVYVRAAVDICRDDLHERALRPIRRSPSWC